MTYQVLARKWRPQDFGSLIGQQAVVTALTNAIAEGRIAQAYLFSGIRGVGKTTAARLLAKALNCERFGVGKAGGPCNDCPTCHGITAGADMDVLEIDAATYSKVEQVRELAESLKYGPAKDRYKVVVLDEVHRLSRQAFDALLKIVEEPPPRLVFIFATTEIDAVPATILSRCQEFLFRRVASGELVRHLAAIALAEGIRASPGALALIARAGEGSVRDAVAILDQLATFGGGEVDEHEAARLMGGIDLALFHELLAAILAGDARIVSNLARKAEENGWDPRQVHANFLAYCRDAVHLALGDSLAAVALPGEESALLARLAASAGYENLLRLLHHLLGSETAIRRSEAGALALEIAWLRAAELPKLIAIEQLLSGNAASAPAGPRRIVAETAPGPTSARSERLVASVAAEPRQPAKTLSVAPPPAAPQEGAEVQTFLEEVSRRKANLAGLLQGLSTLTWHATERALCLEAHDSFAASSLARANNRDLILAAAETALGAGTAVRYLPARPAASSSLPQAATRQPGLVEARAHPWVQSVLSVFGGDVAEIARPEEEEPRE